MSHVMLKLFFPMEQVPVIFSEYAAYVHVAFFVCILSSVVLYITCQRLGLVG